jgi:uncharacterized membrane protein YozB (DUF420 family)
LAVVPLGAEVNLALQSLAVGLLVVGLWAALRTHRELHDAGRTGPPPSEWLHKNAMTAAVVVTGIGLVVWMVPNLLLGWYYSAHGLGYGSGGYASYFTAGGGPLPHSYLLWIHIPLGVLVVALGIYLVLRMRWSRFPARFAVQNFRAVMIATWILWMVNFVVGVAVFYYFAYAQTG